MLTLIGIAIVILGFALKLNPLLVVVAAAIATGLAAGIDLVGIVSEFGRAFTQNRYMALVWLTLPVIGMLEKNGLKERAQALIARVGGATTGRVLTLYMFIRQLAASLGLTAFGGHAAMVRPLVAPMAEAAAENRYGLLPGKTRDLIRAHAAAADNIGLFYGEDIFIAIGSVLLIKSYLDQAGYPLTPLQIALWAIPTAVAAFVIHAFRLWRLDRRLQRELGEQAVNVLDGIYLLLGLMFAAAAYFNLHDRSNPKRLKRALFWALYSVTFLFGSWLPPFLVGCLAIGMALLAGLGGLGKSGAPEPTETERVAGAARFGNKLFVPALLIPLVTVLGTLLLQNCTLGGKPLVELKDATLVALGLSVVVAGLAGLVMLRQPFAVPLTESRRLVDAVGPVVALPQLLAVLGAIFAVSGVGQVVAGLVGRFIPVDSALAVVCAYCIGMALFTLVMGNAFAAFPVMTAGIGLPLIVKLHGGDAAIMGAIGMLAGYSGTLMTPLAANFNIVPAALLELPDQNGVIKVQIPTGLALLLVNTLLMYFLVFR